ncbi:hypothetical protein DFJ58DRAFT_623727, partial [Suillus subalutaceus]|uniref:uncharacterized protein n=1 Tax=Suillus subalutaceus TaxID=48586 RepID=UPI001B8832B0
MNRLQTDPNIEQCPDFTSAGLQASRAPLLSPVIDDAQAVVMLQTIWVATNATLKAQWQQQLDADVLEAEEQQRILVEEEAQQLAIQKAQDVVTAEEDRKKNRVHHIPIPNRPCPNRAAESVLIPDFALRKLDKAQYIELYYWTNHGLTDARLNSRTMDDDSMVPTVGPEGATTWTVASAARPATGVIPDHLLAPLDFSRAIPRFIDSL